MEELKIYVTYHEDRMVEDYKLNQLGEPYVLVNSNNMAPEGEHINYMNPFFSELVTFYWVWKNRKESETIGFCHYRRFFSSIFDVEEGQCQVLRIIRGTDVGGYYKQAHNYQDWYDMIDILDDMYGKGNMYSDYMLHGNVFIPCCCFIMKYKDFEKLCEFIFPVMFAWDKMHGLNLDPEAYKAKARKDFRYDDVVYQQRAMSFLAERLISCYIVCNMRPFSIDELKPDALTV